MSQTSRRYLHVSLACVPFVMMLVLTPFMNRTTPYVLGLPFLLFWIVLSVVMTSVCMFVVYQTDPANRDDADATTQVQS
ncbi:DUF3311 domain-containing protein [Leekyejoonella antrihumi]|nr:DUF3311 domain-containing protein [Leekyejoonella antrihumi]